MPGDGDTFAIAAPAVFDGGDFLHEHCVLVRGDTVQQLLPTQDCPSGVDLLELDFGTLAPGFIDLQVNGGGGRMFNNAPQLDTLECIQEAHRNCGTTSLLPTLLSDTMQQQQAAVAAVRAAQRASNPGILGIHLEGPFFSSSRRGAHHDRFIRSPGEEDITWLCSLQDLRVVLTLAPEQFTPAHIEQLANSGIVLCAGHTEATYMEMSTAVNAGVSGVTHLFNAMSPITAREPGAVGAALDLDALWAGIIADGHHVSAANIRLAQRAKPAGRLLLVSDAMATVGCDEDSFELYGETIHEHQGRLVNGEGKLAGSAIGLIQAVAYAAGEVGIPLAQCLRMASLYPATVLGLEQRLGRISPGYRADLVHFDDAFTVHHTWLAGQRQRH
jgi:N-acetylglucosamine-6-phosphate deacetylase